MKKLIFALPGNEYLAEKILSDPSNSKGEFEHRKFPDDETYLRIVSDVKDSVAVIICGLHHPDLKIFPLILFSETLRDHGASKVILVSPYLPYMRQDKRFKEGEALSSKIFAQTISRHFDHLLTVDPHLHRINSLSEIFNAGSTAIKAAKNIGDYIRKNIPDSLLIGPDSESEQWVKEVAEICSAPYIVLEKKRFGDKDVRIELPDIKPYHSLQPVLLDDIISSARTMMEIIEKLKAHSMEKAVCIGIHAVFSANAYEELLARGVKDVITCNTIWHVSNRIDLSDLIIDELKKL